MFDDQHGNVGRQPLDGLDDGAGFRRRHAGRRLVEQQHLGREAERHSDLDQALAAVGELLHRAKRFVVQAEPLEQAVGLVDDVAAAPCRPMDVAAAAEPLRHRERHVFENRQAAKQRRDLERAHDAVLDALRLGQRRDVGAVEQDAAVVGMKRPGDQVDEAGLAGAVGADERVTRPAPEAEIDAVGDGQSAEALAEAAGFERRRRARIAHRRRLSEAATRSTMPSTPPRANMTISTSSRPIQKYQ